MKLGLALSGGGIKGAAHIGVLKAFEEENIKIEYIAGTSSGSIVSVLYACGYNSEEIYKLFKKYCKSIKYIDLKNTSDILINFLKTGKFKIKGLNSGIKLEKIIKKACLEKGITNINQIKKKILIPAVNLGDGQIYFFTNYVKRYIDDFKYINDIEIEKCVRASCSYPGVFVPYKYKGKELVDGGLRENIPWKELKKQGVDKVICVTFENQKSKSTENLIDVITGSINILSHELFCYEIEGCDYLLKIKTEEISLLDISKIDYLYEIGYNYAKKQIDKIKKLNN